MERQLLHIRYEVFGRVQGVFFRKYTDKKAKELGLVGWVMNTAQNTVIGEAEGPRPAIDQFKRWLQTTGSPKSQITDMRIHQETAISSLSFARFQIRR